MALQHSPLGRLSPELRLKICGLVLAPAMAFRRAKTSATGINESISNFLGLATTCKFIHHEFIHEFYEKVSFALDVEDIFKLAQASPLASGIELRRITGEPLSLTGAHDRDFIKLLVKTLHKHCTNLKIITLRVTDQYESYAVKTLLETFDFAISIDVARSLCGMESLPDVLIIVDHAPLRSAWALVRLLPDDATFDNFCPYDGGHHSLDWWYVRILAESTLGVEAIEYRQRRPEDTKNVVPKQLLGAKETVARAMAEMRPESDTYVSVRKVMSHCGTEVCQWVTLILWMALHMFESAEANGSLRLGG